MDNAAVFAFFNDLFAVYDHLKNGKPMPKPLGSYEDRIKRELAYVEDKSNLEKEKAAYTEYITRSSSLSARITMSAPSVLFSLP